MLFSLKVPFYKFMSRIVVGVIRKMPQTKPVVFCGAGSCLQMANAILQMKPSKLIIVTDKIIHELGLLDKIIENFTENGLAFVVYDEVDPDPTFEDCHKAAEFARRHNCDSVLGFGGGSSLDVAKMVSLTSPDSRHPEKFAGINKAKMPALPLFVVPTTSGTGSEVTLGAVISYTDSHNKDIVFDGKTIPLFVALDPDLITGLPPEVTASAGLDALSHAVEAYINRFANPVSDNDAKIAIRLIFKNLKKAYDEGGDVQAREGMALAAFYAGLAFTRVGTGYVHSIAHQLGRFYNTPHGTANALAMPFVLKYSKEAVKDRLAELAVVIGVGQESENNTILADKFIMAVEKLNLDVGIPVYARMIHKNDIPEIVKSALKEAHFTYGVPKYMNPGTCRNLVTQMAG